jgi:hypothetical protein
MSIAPRRCFRRCRKGGVFRICSRSCRFRAWKPLSPWLGYGVLQVRLGSGSRTRTFFLRDCAITVGPRPTAARRPTLLLPQPSKDQIMPNKDLSERRGKDKDTHD